jgi:dihydroneopterin aldolase/2-amino-4-hydroxy-6-hydroxymethyldihydropteridine diphosphokinase
MDEMIIKDLEVFAYHGVLNEENKLGQKFLICLELKLNLKEAGINDDIYKTVDYGTLCHEIEQEFTKKSYNLIEKAGEELCEFILLKYELIKEVTVTIKKPWAPILKPLKYAAIRLTRKWHTAYIGLGSNLGDKNYNIEQGLKLINDSKMTKTTNVSPLYETDPVGYVDQDKFLNGCAEIKTLLEPKELIKLLLDIEKQLKRERTIKWGPRTLDIDVLLYDNLISSSEEIVIPHPRMHEREFVLKPLNDIAPYIVHPLLNMRISDLLTN